MKTIWVNVSGWILAAALLWVGGAKTLWGEDLPGSLMETGVLAAETASGEYVLVINAADGEGAFWFRTRPGCDNRLLGRGLSALDRVYDLKTSPGGKYIAVSSAGEGHPIVEVVESGILLEKGEYRVLRTVNPYPGTAAAEGWDGDRLILTSDVPLDRLLRGEDIQAEDVSEAEARFLLDIATGEMARVPK